MKPLSTLTVGQLACLPILGILLAVALLQEVIVSLLPPEFRD